MFPDPEDSTGACPASSPPVPAETHPRKSLTTPLPLTADAVDGGNPRPQVGPLPFVSGKQCQFETNDEQANGDNEDEDTVDVNEV